MEIKNKPTDDTKLTNDTVGSLPSSDEDAHLMIYGNIKIRDVDTGEILINKQS